MLGLFFFTIPNPNWDKRDNICIVPPENSEQPKGRSYSSKRTAKVDGLATLLESGEPNSL
jgi:hypothetical protein